MPAKKQITREMILDGALKLLRERGYEALNIKSRAGELGCSTQPVYLSFSGMDELRGVLIPLAVQEFARFMAESSADSEVRLYGKEYIRFAKKEPNLFKFIFMRPNAFAETKKILVPITERTMQTLMDQYHITHEEADYLHDQLWMHAHGIAAMIATDFCDWNMEKAERMLEGCRRTFTAKYEV